MNGCATLNDIIRFVVLQWHCVYWTTVRMLGGGKVPFLAGHILQWNQSMINVHCTCTYFNFEWANSYECKILRICLEAIFMTCLLWWMNEIQVQWEYQITSFFFLSKGTRLSIIQRWETWIMNITKDRKNISTNMRTNINISTKI